MSLEKRTYPNGLTTYIDHMPEAATTAIQAYIPYGSVHEQPGEEGIAHALEHAVFLQTPLFPDKSAMRMHARENGMYRNANTHYTRTLHVTEAVDAEPLVRHLGEVLFRAEIPDDATEHEMKAVRREATTKLDDVSLVHGVAQEFAMSGYPYGRRVIGYHDRLNFNGEQLRAAYESEYIMGAMAVVAVGAASPDEIYAHIDRYFQPNLNTRMPSSTTLVPPTHAGDFVSGYVMPNSPNLHLAVNYPLPAEFAQKVLDDLPRYRIATSVMSDTTFQTLREEKGISYNGGVELAIHNHPNAWSFNGSVTTDPVNVAIANQVFDTVMRAGGDAYSDQEIAAGLAMGKFSALTGNTDVDTRINGYVARIIRGQKVSDQQQLIERVKQLTTREIRDTIDEIAAVACTQPRYEHRTSSAEGIGRVDTIVQPYEIM